MKRLALILGVIALLSAYTFWPEEAECTYCPAIFCTSSAHCPSTCSCLISPGEVSGTCWGID
jgi:hypothetical protein